MENKNVIDLRVAYQVLPIELDGWLSNRINVPEDLVGVIRKSYGDVETFTGRKVLPWNIALPYLFGSQVREIGLVRQKFSVNCWVVDITIKQDNSDSSERVSDWNFSIQLTLKPTKQSAGKFYECFISDKNGAGTADEKISIFDKEIGLALEKKINQFDFREQISKLTKLHTFDELSGEDKSSEVKKIIQQCVKRICEPWGVDAKVIHVIPRRRSVHELSPLENNKNILLVNIEKNKEIEKKRFNWISLINDLGNIIQLAQFVVAVLALFAGLFGADFVEDILDSVWALAFAILILLGISIVMVKPTLRALAVTPRQPNIFLDGLLDMEEPQISTRLKFIRPATLIMLGIWSVCEGFATGWPLRNSGALLATMFFLLFLLIPDEWSRDARLRLFASILPFVFLMFDHHPGVLFLSLVYIIILTLLIMTWGASEHTLTIMLLIVFSPGFARLNLAFCIPVLIGFIAPKLVERGIFSFMAAFAAFGLGYFQIQYQFFVGIGLQTLLQALFWALISFIVGSAVGKNAEKYDLKKDFWIMLLGVFMVILGLLFGQLLLERILINYFANVLWALILISVYCLLPRFLKSGARLEI